VSPLFTAVYMRKFILLFIVLTVTAACYLPGLSGSYIFDDGVNLGMNSSLKIEALDFASLQQAALSGNAGLLQRPISMVSFALNYYFSGDVYHFKATNLGIHLLNGLLVFVFTRLLFKLYFHVYHPTDNHSTWLAIAVAAIWLLHPFNLTGVLYVVQRMTSLAMMFTLAGLALYLIGRQRLLDGEKTGFVAISAGLFLATALAALSKENGALLPLLLLALELILLRWQTPNRVDRLALMAMVSTAALAPVLAGLFYLWTYPDLLHSGYQWRDFSLAERLMTEARVLWFYLHMILLPNMTQMGLHHDDILISRSLFFPWTTLPAMLGMLLLAGSLFVLRKKFPILAFGIAFFLIGHSLESTFIPLEIAAEHRNYLPMLGILLPLTYYAISPNVHSTSIRLRRFALLSVIVLFAGITASRAHQWGDPLVMRTLEVQRHPNSVRANIDIGHLYNYIPPNSEENAIELYDKAAFHYRQAANVGPANVAGLTSLLAMNAERSLQIDSALVEELEHRLATAPFGPPNKNSLIGVARCIAIGSCNVDSEVIDRLYRAALSNPTLTGNLRSQIVSEFDQIPPQVWHR